MAKKVLLKNKHKFGGDKTIWKDILPQMMFVNERMGREGEEEFCLPLIEPEDGAGCATSTFVKPPVLHDIVRGGWFGWAGGGDIEDVSGNGCDNCKVTGRGCACIGCGACWNKPDSVTDSRVMPFTKLLLKTLGQQYEKGSSGLLL